MVAHAVLLEIPLVVSRGRNGGVGQGNFRDHLSLALAGIANPDHPGLAESIPDDAAVAAGRNIRAGVAARFEDVDAAVHRIALGDSAKIDAHPFLRKLHGLILWIEQYVPKVDR